MYLTICLPVNSRIKRVKGGKGGQRPSLVGVLLGFLQVGSGHVPLSIWGVGLRLPSWSNRRPGAGCPPLRRDGRVTPTAAVSLLLFVRASRVRPSTLAPLRCAHLLLSCTLLCTLAVSTPVVDSTLSPLLRDPPPHNCLGLPCVSGPSYWFW